MLMGIDSEPETIGTNDSASITAGVSRNPVLVGILLTTELSQATRNLDRRGKKGNAVFGIRKNSTEILARLELIC
jgi:hypothetical protein